MTTFLRRFLYLVVDGQRPGTWDLHRINMSRLFNQRSPPVGSVGSEVMVDARLPRPTMTFYAPSSEICSGRMNFMLIGRDKVLATDQKGSASIYDAGLHAMCPAPTFSKPKHRPVSVSVGNRLYFLDACGWENRFEALVCEGGVPTTGIECLPMPPYRPAHINAYAVVARSEIWVSTEEDQGTYSFDFDTGGGAWAKQGDWTLPFCGFAEYVPEYKLWFGLSSKKGSNLLCAFNLATAACQQSPPVARHVGEDLCPPKEWQPFSSYLVHLGSGRFCITRLFFDTSRMPADFDGYQPSTTLAVFTAVEVVPCNSKGLRMIRHRSKCYDLGDNLQPRVL